MDSNIDHYSGFIIREFLDVECEDLLYEII